MEKKERTVIHVQLKADGRHFYFGSIAAIYTLFESSDVGISYGSLRNYGLSEDKPYQNAKCIIRKGGLKTIEKGRET